MTITTTTLRAQYNGNGVTTSFSVPFEFLEGSTLKVILTSVAGVDTVKTLTTHYTVTGGGTVQPATGSVVMITPPATGEKLTILRAQPLTQAASYTEGDAFPAKTHEKALDRQAMEVQMLAERTNRALKLKETSANSDLIFPEPEADKIVGWNAAGDELENKTVAALDGVEIIDDDTMASASDETVPTSESVKAYADTKLASSDVIDEDDMASDSATKVPTQQSVKAYADTKLSQTASRTTLDDLAGAANPVVFVKEIAEQNQWYWDSSDLSAEVTADHVFAKVFVPPASDATGASGAFVWAGAHPTGGFWADTETDMRVFRKAGRMLIGEEAQKAWLGYTFSDFTSIEGTWMLEDLKTTYLEKGAQLVVTSDRGGPASLFLARRSDLVGDGVVTDPYMAGVGSVVYNDVAGPVGAQTTVTHRGSWAHYAEAYRVEGAGPAIVAELEIVNLGTEESYRTPYGVRADGDSSRALSIALGVASGAAQNGNPSFPSTPQTATAAISIGNNGAGFLTGIVIDFAACVARANGLRRVMEMGDTAEIAWVYGNAESNVGFTISSINTSSAKQTHLQADTAGAKFRTVRSDLTTQTQAGLSVAWPTLTGVQDINGLAVQPGISGASAPVILTAVGADSVFGMALRPKGAAAVSLQDQSGNNRVAVNATGVGFFGTTPIAAPTGWAVPTGTFTRTTFVTSSVTLPQLAERVAALIQDLHQTAGYGLLRT